MPKPAIKPNWLKSSLVRACRIHFAFVGFYAAYIVAADGTNLITPDIVLSRWVFNTILLVGTAIIWYLAKLKTSTPGYYKGLLFTLIALDILIASFNIYTQRGMASRAVILFILPIILSSLLLNRVAIVLTAILAAAAYSLAAVKYFIDFFNEGYKAELYIEVGFYCAVFFIVAWLLSILISPNRSEK